MAEVALNLWSADHYGDGSSGRGIKLTAYQIREDGSINTSKWVSVKLNKDDLPKGYVVDDEWAYSGSKKFAKWMQLLVFKQIERKK